MVEVEFNYDNQKIIIQCRANDKFINIIKKLQIKAGKEFNDLLFLYGGKNLNHNLTFQEQANSYDKIRKKINIIVKNRNNEPIKDNFITLKEIICPKCNESILIDINKYKINLYACKNQHIISDIFLSEFKDTQKKIYH